MGSKTDQTSSKLKYYLKKLVGNIKFSMVLLCIGILTQSMMVTGALNVSISTIERAFTYNSFQVAFISTVYNIAFALSAFVLGYTVSKKKLKWISSGGLFISLGCFLFILPVFIKGNFQTLTEKQNFLCSNSETTSGDSSVCKSGHIGYLIIMCISYGIIGFGAAPLHTLAVTFIEENASKKTSRLFYGFYYAFAAFGPVFAFLLFFVFSKIPIKLSQPKNTLESYESDEFLSAYWLIFVTGGVLALIQGLLMFITSKNFQTSTKFSSLESKKLALSDFKMTLKNLVSNTSYLCICIGMFFDGIINNGIGVFMTKYVEVQFHVHPGKAGLYAGAILVVGAAIGLFVGGYVLKKFNWNNNQLIKRITIVSLIGTVSLSFILIYCPAKELEGVEITDRGTVMKFTNSQCVSDCHCSIEDYSPVCVDEKENYFSACGLGCSKKSGMPGYFSFEECKCYQNIYNNSTVKQNKCFNECKKVYIFLIFGFIALVVEFLIYIPQITLTMQVLGPKNKLFGVSIQQIVLRLSYVIGPLIYGPLLDLSCRIFKPTSGCLSSSNCIDYYPSYMSYYFALTSITFKFLSTLFLFTANFLIESPIPKQTTDNPSA